jgi:hypothetical protein
VGKVPKVFMVYYYILQIFIYAIIYINFSLETKLELSKPNLSIFVKNYSPLFVDTVNARNWNVSYYLLLYFDYRNDLKLYLR